MESESASAPSPSKPETKPKSHIKIIAVIAVAVIAVVIGAFLVTAFLSQPQGQSAWLFKGAYAEYEGSTSMTVMTIDVEVSFAVRQEVVDFNSTHALVSTSFQMSSSVGESVEDENTTWVPLSQAGFINAFDEGNFTESYEATVDIPGIGARTCTVYEFEISDDGLTMTVYVDKAIGWPLKMTVSTDEAVLGLDLELDINLVETNIPSLK